MFAGFDGGVDLAEMKIGRGTNIDDVDIGSADRGIEIGEELRDCVFFGESAGALGIDIANGGNLEEVWGSSKSFDMLCTDTGTDNDDSQGFSHFGSRKTGEQPFCVPKSYMIYGQVAFTPHATSPHPYPHEWCYRTDGPYQHLIRSILAIREQGGLRLVNGEYLWPEPILVGRNEARVRALADELGLNRWTTNLDAALADPDISIYFDTQVTSERAAAAKAAIAAGKHIYCEKPIAEDLQTALELARLATKAGIKNGVVQDKLFLPGLRKLKHLIESGFFGRVLSVRGEFGYWVFEGDWQTAQRPSWNYRLEEGGGMSGTMKRVIVTTRPPTTPPTRSFGLAMGSSRKSILLGAFAFIGMNSSAYR